MTTPSKTLKPTLLAVAFSAILLVSACTKDETDLRDPATGQYEYTVKIYEKVGENLVYLGNQGTNYDLTGTMRVVKNSTDPLALDFYDNNILMFQAVDARDAGNALVFDIPKQELWIGPANVQVAGYTYWTVNSTAYHGAFLYDDSSFEIAFASSVMDVDTGLVMVLTATRK